MSVNLSNQQRAASAWGNPMPEWVRLLAEACDRSSQGAVARELDRSNGYVNRLIHRTYAGSYPEAENIVRAKFSADEVACPLWGKIPLASCLQLRRRKAAPQNRMHQTCARTCPTCPNNTDRPATKEA